MAGEPMRRPPGRSGMAERPRLRVLVVEDHPVISLRLEVTLAILGQEVVGVAVDVAGVRRLDLAGVDLAIVDVNLADGPTGLAIASDLASAGVAVVFHTTEPDRIPAEFADAIGVLEKPFTPEALSELVHWVGSTVLTASRRGSGSG